MEKLLFITDLDASLLCHDYSYEAAKPALQKLRELSYPLIFNSSKTIAELTALATELGSTAPIVAENGGVVGIHKQSNLSLSSTEEVDGNYAIMNTGLSRNIVLDKAHQLRSVKKLQFKGFADWSPAELSSITKLDEARAALALERYVTEPILWNDTDEAFSEFVELLAKDNIQVIRGGKFTHLMGPSDKADGAQKVIELYQQAEPNTDWTVIAIGDSENDLKMLDLADISVVIPHDGEIRIKPQNPNTIFAKQEASAGWAEAVTSIINQ